MATLAYSRPAPAVRGGPVTQAVAAMRGGAQQEQHCGLGCIILDEGPVFFDANRYPREGDPILVVFGDGRIEVATMPRFRDDGRAAHSPNMLMVDADEPYGSVGRVCREQATLIGLVTTRLS